MTKAIIAILVVLMVSGCDTPEKPKFIVEKPVVFVPDDKFFYCPVVQEFPDPTTLTDEGVAELLVTLDTYNRTCQSSLQALRRQLLDAKKKLEQQP
jgi:hypothetical protein